MDKPEVLPVDIEAAKDFMFECAPLLGDCGMKNSVESALREHFAKARHRISSQARPDGELVELTWHLPPHMAAREVARMASSERIAPQGEPAAWLYEIPGTGVFRLYKSRYVSPQQVAEGWTETPLYAALSSERNALQPDTERAQIVAWLLNEADARQKEFDALPTRRSPLAAEIAARVGVLRRSAKAIEQGKHLASLTPDHPHE